MPKRTDLRSILILGSGPIRIGQACEFDYSGAQACRVLRREGYRVVLVNSNPATIMTDPEWADATYLEPLDAETVAQVIERERPDAILPTLGGQTALNLAVELAPLGIELIGADLEAINRAEDRELFRSTVHSVGIPTPRSMVAHSPESSSRCPRSCAPRSRSGARAAGSRSAPRSCAPRSRTASPRARSTRCWSRSTSRGWQEHELEVMCDARGNAVVVCSIENLDPMGVHTGDSWTVAPQQTLPDPIYQQLREAAFATARAVGVATGGANVQFAVHPASGEFRVIEMNPRVSRSSALASKATGFPIAKLAALLAVGYTLDELPNDITGKTTAAFEPALDYVAVKAPRFDFEKFPLASTRLGAEMRAVGEALGLGRTFAEAFVKAIEGREAPPVVFPADDEELVARASEPLAARWDLLLEAARRGLELPGYPPLLRRAGCARSRCGSGRRGGRVRLAVDSCAGEFEARTPYYYVTHEGADEGPEPSGRAVIVLGGGPEPDRPGDRVRLLLRPRRPGAAPARLRGGARQLEPGDGLDRLRHLRPALPRAARRAQRARGLRARAAARRRRLLRRADAAAARARARRGRRAAARRPARGDRRRRGSRPLRPARGRARAGVGAGRKRRGGARARRTRSAIRCSSGPTT